ncbi:unnamed protein product [Chrysoparadoxa australica]
MEVFDRASINRENTRCPEDSYGTSPQDVPTKKEYTPVAWRAGELYHVKLDERSSHRTVSNATIGTAALSLSQSNSFSSAASEEDLSEEEFSDGALATDGARSYWAPLQVKPSPKLGGDDPLPKFFSLSSSEDDEESRKEKMLQSDKELMAPACKVRRPVVQLQPSGLKNDKQRHPVSSMVVSDNLSQSLGRQIGGFAAKLVSCWWCTHGMEGRLYEDDHGHARLSLQQQLQ